MSKKEFIDMEAERPAAMKRQEEMAEKLAIMYAGKLDLPAPPITKLG